MRKGRFFGFMKPRVATCEWDGEVRTLTPPERVMIPLSRPGREQLQPIVKVGHKVRSGQPVAAAPSGHAVHATITGEVTRIDPTFTPDGQEIPGIEILCSGKDDWMEPVAIEDLRAASREQIIEGLAHLGFDGPWKPDALLAQAPSEQRLPVRTVVIMALEREPGLSVQSRFLREYAGDLAESINAMRRLAADARILLVVPQSLQDSAAEKFPGVEIRGVTDRYPQNHWRVVLAHIAGTGNLTIPAAREAGILMLTAENAAFAGASLKRGLPRFEKLLTVAGKGLQGPVTVSTRLGTPIGHVLEQLDIVVEDGDRVLLGAHWQGHAQFDMQAPVTLGTDGLTVIPAESIVHLQEHACTNCGSCVRVCPVSIQVNLVARLAEFGFGEEAYENGAKACIECGICAYVCPVRRPLVQYMRFGVISHQKTLLEKEEEAEAEGETET